MIEVFNAERKAQSEGQITVESGDGPDLEGVLRCRSG